MRRKFSAVALALFCSAICAAAAESTPEVAPDRERGALATLKRTWSNTVEGVGSVGETVGHSVLGIFKKKSTPKISNLELKLTYEPQSVSLSKDRQIKAVLRLLNNGKRTQMLQFVSTQRADAVIHDISGKIVARASEDHEYSNESAVVTVNPGERLEFELNLSTRQLLPGKTYTLEAAVTNQDGLRVTVPVSVLP